MIQGAWVELIQDSVNIISAATAYSFIYTSNTTLYISSFPTRRSSDLSYVMRALQGTASTSARRIPRLLADVEDRKSTRLNSSHMSISYAVFCLRKKKIYDGLRSYGSLSMYVTTFFAYFL